jgi:AraC-like DNA-binding protein
MAVFAPALSQVWQSAKSLNLDPEALFREAGVDPELRFDGNARVSERLTNRLLWIAKQQSGDNAFAFKVADHLHPSYLGAIGYAWLTSATLRKACQRLERYSKMLADNLSVELMDQDAEFLVFVESTAQDLLDPAMRERIRLAILIRLFRLNCGDSFNASRICFQHAEPTDTETYYAFFKCGLEFSSPRTVVVLPRSVADSPLPGFDAHLVTMHDKMILDYLARLDKSDIAGRTRALLLEHLPSGKVNIDDIAGELHMSARSLRRKLGRQGLAFKGLLAGIRRDLGEKYIRDKSLSLTEISFLLGFSDTSSFSRAFKSWTGISPSAARKQPGA